MHKRTEVFAPDTVGTLLLALTLAAFALAVTMGRGRFGVVNLLLFAAAALGVGLFVGAEARAASPLMPSRHSRARSRFERASIPF